MRSKMLVLCSALALVVMLGASSARADQIALGDTCDNGITVSGTVNPTVGISGGSSITCQNVTWEFGGTVYFPTTLTHNWSLDSTGTAFSVNLDSSSLSGTINWTDFGGSNQLVGWLTVSSESGFNDAFSQGGVYHIDLTLTGPSNGVYGVSTGQVPVPEPGSLMLFGTGLLSIGGFMRRKLFS